MAVVLGPGAGAGGQTPAASAYGGNVGGQTAHGGALTSAGSLAQASS